MVLFIYQKWIILKVKFYFCLRIASIKNNENAPIFNKKFNVIKMLLNNI